MKLRHIQFNNIHVHRNTFVISNSVSRLFEGWGIMKLFALVEN